MFTTAFCGFVGHRDSRQGKRLGRIIPISNWSDSTSRTVFVIELEPIPLHGIFALHNAERRSKS